jgi:hypothetical protein
MDERVQRLQKLINMCASALFAMAFGGLAFWLYASGYVTATRLVDHGVEVRGEVYNRYYSACSSCAAVRSRARIPTDVRYADPHGRLHTTRLTINAHGRTYVRVLLDPANPDDCAILEYGETYAVSPVLIFSLVASVVLALGSAGCFVSSFISSGDQGDQSPPDTLD